MIAINLFFSAKEWISCLEVTCLQGNILQRFEALSRGMHFKLVYVFFFKVYSFESCTVHNLRSSE